NPALAPQYADLGDELRERPARAGGQPVPLLRVARLIGGERALCLARRAAHLLQQLPPGAAGDGAAPRGRDRVLDRPQLAQEVVLALQRPGGPASSRLEVTSGRPLARVAGLALLVPGAPSGRQRRAAGGGQRRGGGNTAAGDAGEQRGVRRPVGDHEGVPADAT